MNNIYRYFRAKSTGEYFSEKQLGVVKSITGNTIDQLVENGSIEEIADPEILDILAANGSKNVYPAVMRYKQLHHVTTKEANEIIYGVLNSQKPSKDKRKNHGNNDNGNNAI